MIGVNFSFDNFKALLDLNIGMASRLNENRSESFTLLFCDFSQSNQQSIDENIGQLLRTSDSIVHYKQQYFFVMPYTDRYGSDIVKGMINDKFSVDIRSAAVCYPANGETSIELLESLYAAAKKAHNINLECLDAFLLM